MPTVRILALPGSLRTRSYNRQLLEAAAALAPDGVEVEVYDRIADIPMFNQDDEDQTPAAVAHLRASVAASDAVLIATPEYNGSVPGALKNLLDWLSRGDTVTEGIKGRPVAVIGATPGMWGTKVAQEHARQICSNMGADTLYSPRVYLARAATAFEDDQLVDEVAATTLTSVLAALADRAEHRAQHQAAQHSERRSA